MIIWSVEFDSQAEISDTVCDLHIRAIIYRISLRSSMLEVRSAPVAPRARMLNIQMYNSVPKF